MTQEQIDNLASAIENLIDQKLKEFDERNRDSTGTGGYYTTFDERDALSRALKPLLEEDCE